MLEKAKLKLDFKKEFLVYKHLFMDANDDTIDHNEESMKFAFITFRSMDDIARVEKAYKPDKCERCCIYYCKKTKIPELENKYLFKQWP
jgi:hypothetical protein